MLSSTIPRILLLALLFAVLEYIAIIPILAILMVITVFAHTDFKKQPQYFFLGLITSMLSPSLVIDNYSYFFLKTGMLCNGLFLFATWVLYYLITGPEGILNSSKETTIFECIYSELNFNSTYRCQYNSRYTGWGFTTEKLN